MGKPEDVECQIITFVENRKCFLKSSEPIFNFLEIVLCNQVLWIGWLGEGLEAAIAITIVAVQGCDNEALDQGLEVDNIF